MTRFSGRTAPPHPGGAPNCGPHVMWEAYSHEVISTGYWPGPPGKEGVFYAYAYPEPEGMRTAPDPQAALLELVQSTYEAAAQAAKWDRRALER